MTKEKGWALPFFWKKKGGWYIYNWDNETYYLMSPTHIPNNGKTSPYKTTGRVR